LIVVVVVGSEGISAFGLRADEDSSGMPANVVRLQKHERGDEVKLTIRDLC
jgi:hypothetical protein